MNKNDLAQYTDKLVELYLLELENTSFSLGYIRVVNDTSVLFTSINEMGQFDSLEVFDITVIRDVKQDTPYIDMFTKLIQYNKDVAAYDIYNLEADLKSLDDDIMLDALIDHTIDSGRLLTVMLNDELITGKILSHDETKVELLAFDFNEAVIVDRIYLDKVDIVGLDIISVQNHLIDEYLKA